MTIAEQGLLDRTLKNALNTTKVLGTKDALKTFAKSIALVATVGMIASALETWESWGKFNDSSKTDLERFGYLLKAGATGAQGIIFYIQFFTLLGSGIGGPSIAAISAGWMLMPFCCDWYCLFDRGDFDQCV